MHRGIPCLAGTLFAVLLSSCAPARTGFVEAGLAETGPSSRSIGSQARKPAPLPLQPILFDGVTTSALAVPDFSFDTSAAARAALERFLPPTVFLQAETAKAPNLPKAETGKGPQARPETSPKAPDPGPGPAEAWNRMARFLVAKYNWPPPLAARAYALLSVTQHDAWAAAAPEAFRESGPGGARAGVTRPFPEAAVVGASMEQLYRFFGFEMERLQYLAYRHGQVLKAARPGESGNWDRDFEKGRAVARRLYELREDDGYRMVWTGEVPRAESLWFNVQRSDRPGILPRWGEVQPWLASRADSARFALPPPPALNSPEFGQAHAALKRIAYDRTPAQIQAVFRWGDGIYTPTPPGHWNAIACSLAADRRLDEARTLQMLASVNMALMDASIWCWKVKYAHLTPRPSQIDHHLIPLLALPNFPSYPSGHATFSAAAAVVLSHFFPEAAARVEAMAREAADSRAYAALHFPFDNSEGMTLGRKVGQAALEHLEARKSLTSMSTP